MALETMQLEGCSYAGRFHPQDANCHTCEFMRQCAWLESNEPFVALAQRPLVELITALRSSIRYVDLQSHGGRQPRRTCVCEACRWLSDARLLMRQAQGKSEVVHAH